MGKLTLSVTTPLTILLASSKKASIGSLLANHCDWGGIKTSSGKIFKPVSCSPRGSSHRQGPGRSQGSWWRRSWSPAWCSRRGTNPHYWSPPPLQPHRRCPPLTPPSDIGPLSEKITSDRWFKGASEGLTSAMKRCFFAYKFASSINSLWSGVYCIISPWQLRLHINVIKKRNSDKTFSAPGDVLEIGDLWSKDGCSRLTMDSSPRGLLKIQWEIQILQNWGRFLKVKYIN